MEKSCYSIFAFAVLLVSVTLMPCLAKTSATTDQSALVSLKALLTLDPHHILTRKWTNSSSVCSWIGVTCGLRHHRVTALNISNMNLSGTISPQLGSLSFLISLDLGYNHFSGTLPREFSLLRRLKFISLKVNNFTGGIPPWFGLLSKLEHLSLRNNSFNGFIPPSLSNLSNLNFLDFSFNDLHGEIPQELGRLHNLQLLSMQFNHLSGVIPSAIYNVSTLQAIAFTSNELSGTLPINMCDNLPFLQGIYLTDNHLTGPIPSNLSHCSKLQILSLSYNSFSGHIPAAFGELTSLHILALGGNNLNGVLPKEIGNLQNLVELYIEKCNISGTLPLNIFNLSSLQTLVLGSNNLSGSLSRDVGNLTMLQDLELHYNQFTGVIPTEISQLYQLEILQLDSNAISGSIPGELFNISTLGIVGLSGNYLSGALPANLCYGSPLVQQLYLGVNNLRGTIPNSVSNCAHLTLLDLSYNRFTGILPQFLGNISLLVYLHLSNNHLRIEPPSSELNFISSLTNCTSLKYFVIDYNPLDGTIPPSIGNLSSTLQIFSAANCKIKGKIPEEIRNLSNLLELDFSGNDLSGVIPHSVRHLLNLQKVDLHMNNLGGPIPDGLCDLHSLFNIHLSQNKLIGPIPQCLGNISSLLHIFLDSNKLNSSIPSSLGSLKDLLSLDLSSNSLSGILPLEIGNLMQSIYVNLSMNNLSGSIPSTIGNLQSLINLSLAHNRLEGSIPAFVGMISLVALDLSNNELSGSIPKSLEDLQYLDYFNVSFNYLSGEIPSGGPFRNFTIESFKGNDALCESSRHYGFPICRTASGHNSTRKKVEFSLFILAGVVVLITVVTLIFIYVRCKRKDMTINGIVELPSHVPQRISYNEILQATKHFNESNLLGTGSYGSVYRGNLRDGMVIAVKVFSQHSEAAFNNFGVECEVLRNIRHRNLTKVLTSCSNEEFKALVLEYMPNADLEKWLYSHNYFLDVRRRLDIMIDVASALEYLHHGYSTPIVHCDLKPSNVLLDEEMVAHVSDFGISKLLGDEQSTVLTNTLATLGYIAPEYGLEGMVSTRCDVYSYGIMLMETFTRKRPNDDMFGGDLSLKSWVESLLPQAPDRVVDPNLFITLNDEQGDKILRCASSILVLALKCSTESPRERINMKEALVDLQKIKRRFFTNA
ncbi:hypothetical protein ACS0TY_018067 [Phlomoides rotata]